MSDLPTVSIVIPTYNRKRQLLRLLNSIFSSNYPLAKLQIIIIDDASTDGTFEAVKLFKDRTNLDEDQIIILRNSKELFVSACRNLGIEVSRGDYILFLDDDFLLDSNAIPYLIKYVKRNKVIAGPVIYYLNKPDTIWCAGFKINKLFVIPKCIGRGKKGIVYSNYIVCDALPSPFIVSRECALRIRFDDTFKFCNEDVDFCLRASKLGYKIIVVPEAKVWHDRRTYNSIYELFYIKKPEIGYFLFRNVFILCKKLNKRIHMFVVSLALTLILNLINILIVITLTHNKIVGRNIVRGLIDGFRLAVTTPMESY